MTRYIGLDRKGWDVSVLEANFEIYLYLCPDDKRYIRDSYEKITGRDFLADYELYTGICVQDQTMDTDDEDEDFGVDTLPPVNPCKLVGSLPPNGPARRGEEEWEPGYYYYSNDFGYNLGYPKPIDYYSDPAYVDYTDDEIAVLMEAQMEQIQSTAILSPRYAPLPRAATTQPQRTPVRQELASMAVEPQPQSSATTANAAEEPQLQPSTATEHDGVMNAVTKEDIARLDSALIALSESRRTQDPTSGILSAVVLCEPMHLSATLGTKRTWSELDIEDEDTNSKERCVVKKARNELGDCLEFSLSGIDVKIYERQLAAYVKVESSVQRFLAGGKTVVVHTENFEQATCVLQRFRRMYRSGLVDL